MLCDTPRTKGWERSNLMRNVIEKTFENMWKNGMTNQVDNQAFTPRPTRDLKRVWCELKGR